MSSISFELNLTNVKEIVCETNLISLKLDKVVDGDGNILWQKGNKTVFINIYFYNVYGEKAPIDTVFCGGYFQAAYELVDEASNIVLFDDTDYTSLINVRFFFVDSYGNQVINYDDYIDYAYAGYKYGVSLSFNGGEINSVNYLSTSTSYILPKVIYSDKGIPTEIIRNSSDVFVATCSSPIMQQSTSTDWDWIITAHTATSADFKRIKHSEVFSYVSNLTFTEFKTGVEDFNKNNGGTIASDFIIGPWFLTAEARSNITYIPDDDDEPENYTENFRYSKLLFYPVEWTSSKFSYDEDEDYTDIIVYLDSSYKQSIFMMLTYEYDPGTSFYVNGKYSLYSDEVKIQTDISFSTLKTITPNEAKSLTLTTGEAVIVSDGTNNPYLRIGTGIHNLDFGRTYKAELNVNDTPFVKYSSSISKLLRPFIYEWGTSSNGGTEPELCLGSSINSWPSTTTSSSRLSNYIYLAVYDHPDDSAITDMTFSGKIQLYKNGSYHTTVSFSAVKPNQYGNLILTTGLQYDPNVDYKAILTIDPGYRNGFAGLASYEVTNGNANMRGTYVDVSSVSGASVTYISSASASSGYGARISFNSHATYTVRVKIRQRAIGQSTWSDWRVYSIFVNDGNKSWTDKATMLIDTTDVTTAAWYYKNGYSYGVEIGLTKGYEYQFASIVNDDTSYYDSVVIYPSVTSHVYTGATQTGYTNSNSWTVSKNFTGDMITCGSYSYAFTKTNPLQVWKDDYTRLKVDKTILYTITKAYWSVNDTNVESTSNKASGDSIKLEKCYNDSSYNNVVLRAYDLPNGAASVGKDLPKVSWKLYSSSGTLLTEGSNIKATAGTNSSAVAIGVKSNITTGSNGSGNLVIHTGYKQQDYFNLSIYGIITIEETNNMKPAAKELTTASTILKSRLTGISKPKATTSKVYNGEDQNAFPEGDHYTVSGGGKYVGDHPCYATPDDGYFWSDSLSTKAIEETLTITKATQSKPTVAFDTLATNKNVTFTVTKSPKNADVTWTLYSRKNTSNSWTKRASGTTSTSACTATINTKYKAGDYKYWRVEVTKVVNTYNPVSWEDWTGTAYVNKSK